MSKTLESFELHREAISATLHERQLLSGVDEARAQAEDKMFEYQRPFSRLGTRLFMEYKDLSVAQGYSDMPWVAIGHGFHVAAIGIAGCKEAYEAHYGKVDETPTLKELRAALLSKQTVKVFTSLAMTDNDRNKKYEIWLGLTNEVSNGNHFVFMPDEPHFTPNPDDYDYAAREARWLPELEDHRVCPAARFVPHIWRSTVAACETEGLLALDSESSKALA